jgi:tetratricopeptide (TPR) repeat protein
MRADETTGRRREMRFGRHHARAAPVQEFHALRRRPQIVYPLLAGFFVWAALLFTVESRADDAIWRNHMATAAEATKRGDHAAAVQMYEAAAKQAELSAAGAVRDVQLTATYTGLAQAYRAQHMYKPAEAHYLRALALLESLKGLLPEQNATVLNGLGDLYRLQGRYAEAESYYRRELAILEKTLGAGHPAVAQALSNNLAALYRVQARREETEAIYLRSLAIMEKAVPATDERLGLALIDLAEWYQGQQRYAEAEQYYRRGIHILQAAFPAAHPRILLLLQDWGTVTQLLGRYRDAEAVYGLMLSLIEKAFGAQHPNVGVALNNFVGLYEIQGRQAEADAVRKRMLELRNTQYRGKPYVPYQVPPARKR